MFDDSVLQYILGQVLDQYHSMSVRWCMSKSHLVALAI